ncbi:MAG: type 4 pilus major pilin [Sedimenticola sp.]
MKKISSVNVKKQRGFSLISVLLGGIAVLVALAGVMALVQNTTTNTKLNETESILSSLKSDIIRLYGSPADFTGLDNATVIKAGLIPPSKVTGATTISHPFGGAINIEPDTVVPNIFKITLTAIDKEPCMSLAVFSHGDWVAVEVGGKAITQSATRSAAVKEALANCADGVDIVWKSQ